nr:hypothetical protein pJBCL41_00531 [Pseudomonas sp.]
MTEARTMLEPAHQADLGSGPGNGPSRPVRGRRCLCDRLSWMQQQNAIQNTPPKFSYKPTHQMWAERSKLRVMPEFVGRSR